MRARGLGDPLLVVSDGAPGVIKAIETCFPRSARQRCLAHRMRNLAAKVPEDVWPEVKARIQAAYQAPSRAIARELAKGVVADFEIDTVVLDLRRLDFMDSTGLRLVILADSRAKEAGQELVVVRGRPDVQRVFAITRMEDRLAFVDDAGEVTG